MRRALKARFLFAPSLRAKEGRPSERSSGLKWGSTSQFTRDARMFLTDIRITLSSVQRRTADE